MALRFGLRDRPSRASRETHIVSTRRFLEVERQSIEDALEKRGGKIYLIHH
jgi:hypothetical protein